MSNWFNQHYAVPQMTGDRFVIDSNRRAEERIRRSLREQDPDRVPDEDGFIAGLDAPLVEEEEEEREDPEQVLAEAHAEAEAILEAARAEADHFLTDARAEADRLYQQQKKVGYDEGKRKSEEEAEQLRKQLEEDYQRRIDEYYAEYEREYQRIEPDLVDTMIRVFDKVFGIQFEDKRPILLALVDNTMHSAESAKTFLIRVSEANRAYLEEHLEELRAKVAADVEINVASDVALSEDYCRIETEYGVFDCSIDTELGNLLRDIRSLCE